MNYKLSFDPRALKEWHKLSEPLKTQFKKKLKMVLETPEIPANRLHHLANCYKIKLRSSGYRLVYRVDNNEVSVLVIAIGKRDKSTVYTKATKRLA